MNLVDGVTWSELASLPKLAISTLRWNMTDTIAVSPTVARSKGDWFGLARKGAAWALLLVSFVYYIRRAALHYLFQCTLESFKSFWSIRVLIRIHVAFAIIMIFSGPLQFWTGFRMRYLTLHTWCGRVCENVWRVWQESQEAFPKRTPDFASVAIWSGDLRPILWQPPQPFMPSVMDMGW